MCEVIGIIRFVSNFFIRFRFVSVSLLDIGKNKIWFLNMIKFFEYIVCWELFGYFNMLDVVKIGIGLLYLLCERFVK